MSSAGSGASDDGGGIFSLAYCIEMEFLVAKEREGYDYSDGSDDYGSDESSLFQIRWLCPAEEQDPHLEILRQCRDVFTKNNEHAVIIAEPDPASALPWDSAEHDSWVVQRASHAAARPGSPSEYEWFGVRIRSPLLPESEATNQDSTVKWCIGALRMALLVHVNSTCPFSVHVRASGIGLTNVKKLVTLVWLVEPDMLLRLRAASADDTPGRAPPVTSHAAVATLPLEGVDSSRPRNSLIATAMGRHLPRLHDDATQERVQRLWACSDLGELAETLRASDGRPLAFSLHAPPPGDATAGNGASDCVAAFRYALWHPYDDLDVSGFWVELALVLCRVMQTERRRYKKSTQHTDEIIQGFEARSVEGSARWKILMERLGLTEDWYCGWDKIVRQYATGGRLSSQELDRQPALGQIPELQIYRSR